MNNPQQLSAIEIKMFEEIFQVFSKYASTTRHFGIQLVHSHFPIMNEEVLYETHDIHARKLSTKVVKKSDLQHALATAWYKTEDGQLVVSSFCCESPDGQEQS